MKNSTWVTIGLVIAVLFGALFQTPPLLAQVTSTPSHAITGTFTRVTTISLTTTLTMTMPPATATRRPPATPTLTGSFTPTSTVSSQRTVTATSTLAPQRTLTATPTLTGTVGASTTPTTTLPAPSATITPTSTSTPTATRYPLALNPTSLSIESLRARTYGSGPIKVTQTISSDSTFKRVLFEYPSDGLRITGMMNIPVGTGPFPVVILDHGYFKPAEYKTGDGTRPAADNFVRHGYLTLSPDYRCYGGSQCGPDPLYVGYAIDVLNLIASLPSLPYADTSKVGIWGHSMGGQVTLRVLTLTDKIKVASLYGALTGDDEVHYCWLNGCRTPVAPTREPYNRRLAEIDPDFTFGLPTPAPAAADPLAKLREVFVKSSPSKYMGNINAPLIVHHGESDDIVPIQWSVDLVDSLNALGKPAFLYTYPGEGHVFAGWGWQLFMARTVSFFNEYLNPREVPVTVERRVLRQERGILDLGY